MLTRLRKFLREQLAQIDWKLLVFLLLLVNVKFAVKLLAVAFIYIVRPDFKLNRNLRQSDFPPFYSWIAVIAILDFFIYKGFSNLSYIIAFSLATGIWIICMLISHQMRLATQLNKAPILHNTITVFFVINIIVSIATIAFIVFDAGTINPYRYQGMYQKYFIGTGDLIKGVTFDTSTANAIINAAGVLYFLNRKQIALTLLCMSTLLLTGSNFTNIILVLILIVLFIFKSSREQKSAIVICTMLLIIFMVKVSPQNDTYALKIVNKILGKKSTAQDATPAIAAVKDTILTPEQSRRAFAEHYLDSIRIIVAQERQQQHKELQTLLPPATSIAEGGRPVIAQPSIHSQPFQRKHDTTQMQIALQHFEKETNTTDTTKESYAGKLPGKAIAFIQTGKYLSQHPVAMVIGAGAGNFSSKVAFRTAALNINGNYPARFAYINPAFRANHLETYLSFFSKDIELHSVVNTPNSVYNQLAGEYGIAGLIAFALGYLWFFGRHIRKHFFIAPLLLLLCGVCFMDYWFEQLSIVVIIELLLFATMRPSPEKAPQ